MINTSRELEEHYGKLFDLTVVNKNIDEVYDRITEAMERLGERGALGSRGLGTNGLNMLLHDWLRMTGHY